MPVTDEHKKTRTEKSRHEKKTGLSYDKFYSITDGSGDEGLFLILWSESELTLESYFKSQSEPQQQKQH